MAISFVYYFHSMRIENLKQTLRMLLKREHCIREVILVCNDRTDERFEGCRLYNMNLKNYQKPTMCNFGVDMASGEAVALMDSDRVLPEGYFGEIAKSARHGMMFSCDKMLNLNRDHTDEELESGTLDCWEEEKSREYEIRMKNLFSGNTVFMKEDYVRAGGMDENFVGYGFADNDMTCNVMRMGVQATWMDEKEIHLAHAKETMENRQIVGFEKYRHTSQRNLNRFIRKWDLRQYSEHYRHMIL